MADEQQTQEAQSEAGAESAGQENESAQESQAEDYEGKYKALQAEHQKAVEERDEAKNYLEAVSPYVDFDKLQSGGEEEGQEKPAATADDLKTMESRIDNKLLTIDFRQKHPELREYEKTIVGPAIQRIRIQNPRMPIDRVLEKAADESKSFIEAERAKGRAEAEKKKAEAAAAGGLGSASTTSKKEDVEAQGEDYDEYLSRRKKQSAKARGLI